MEYKLPKRVIEVIENIRTRMQEKNAPIPSSIGRYIRLEDERKARLPKAELMWMVDVHSALGGGVPVAYIIEYFQKHSHYDREKVIGFIDAIRAMSQPISHDVTILLTLLEKLIREKKTADKPDRAIKPILNIAHLSEKMSLPMEHIGSLLLLRDVAKKLNLNINVKKLLEVPEDELAKQKRDAKNLHETLINILSSLEPKHQQMINQRYYEGMSLEGIAEKRGITKQRVSQIMKKTASRLS